MIYSSAATIMTNKGAPVVVPNILDEFRVRDDSHRARLLSLLVKRIGKQVPLTEVMDTVYGRRKGSMQAYANVVWNIERIIQRRRLPYEIVRQKKKKGMTIGLYQIESDDSKVITQRATLAEINPKGRLAGDDS